MVGLSVVLEGHHHQHHQKKSATSGRTKIANGSSSHPQVINKTSVSAMAIHSANKLSSLSSSSSSSSSHQMGFPVPGFLEKCFLCNVKLLPGKDIYMYKGDRAFCSVECRCRQIFMDDQEETLKKENCSMAAIKPSPASSTPSSPSAPVSSRHRRAPRNHRAGGFAY